MQVTVVGASSLIARALQQRAETQGWRWLSHGQALSAETRLDEVGIVLNCAFAPGMRQGPYDAELDIDLALAKRILHRPKTSLVMLSTRMVYGLSMDGSPWHEAMPCRPHTPYGRNKMQIEQQLQALLGDRLTVLRLSNVFGLEMIPGRRSFMAQAQQALLTNGCITLDVSPFVMRDFMPVQHLAETLVHVMQHLQPGCFNLAAGVSVSVGRVMQHLTQGLGCGHMLISDWREHDPFSMDIGRAASAFGVPHLAPSDVLSACSDMGVALRTHLREPACST